MGTVYFMGAKAIQSKKSGKKFFPATFLHQNSWGDWETVTKFCDSEDVFTQIQAECEVGAPVALQLGLSGEVLGAVQHDTVPALLLDTQTL